MFTEEKENKTSQAKKKNPPINWFRGKKKRKTEDRNKNNYIQEAQICILDFLFRALQTSMKLHTLFFLLSFRECCFVTLDKNGIASSTLSC